jgi:hypothetical protein
VEAGASKKKPVDIIGGKISLIDAACGTPHEPRLVLFGWA